MGKKTLPDSDTVLYRFLLTLRDDQATFLDNGRLLQFPVSYLQKKQFYDLLDLMVLSAKTSVESGRWFFYFSYPTAQRLIAFAGRSLIGERIMNRALSILYLKPDVMDDGA